MTSHGTWCVLCQGRGLCFQLCLPSPTSCVRPTLLTEFLAIGSVSHLACLAQMFAHSGYWVSIWWIPVNYFKPNKNQMLDLIYV